jgi:hypothetical protein
MSLSAWSAFFTLPTHLARTFYSTEEEKGDCMPLMTPEELKKKRGDQPLGYVSKDWFEKAFMSYLVRSKMCGLHRHGPSKNNNKKSNKLALTVIRFIEIICGLS